MESFGRFRSGEKQPFEKYLGDYMREKNGLVVIYERVLGPEGDRHIAVIRLAPGESICAEIHPP